MRARERGGERTAVRDKCGEEVEGGVKAGVGVGDEDVV